MVNWTVTPNRSGRRRKLPFTSTGRRAMHSRLSDRPIVDSVDGFSSAALQALTKLGVPWEPSDSVRKVMPKWRRRDPQSELAVVPEASHCSNIDSPAFFNRITLEWLGRVIG